MEDVGDVVGDRLRAQGEQTGNLSIRGPFCRASCGGTRWVRYLSETMDGDFEEAFRLCACNYEPEGPGERARENLEIVEQRALTGRIRLAARAVTLEICIGPNTATLR